MPPTRTERLAELLKHIDAMIELAGLDRSESATEIFATLLHEASIRARNEIQESHKLGLSLDCRWIIADTLAQNKWIRVPDGKKSSRWVWPEKRTQ